MPERLTRAQILLLFLILTAGIASGLAIFTSASRITELLQIASAGVVLPLLLSLVAAFLLDPLVDYLERQGLSRTTGIFLIFFCAGFLFYLLIGLLSPHWVVMWDSLRQDLPRYVSRGGKLLQDLQLKMHDYFPFFSEFDLIARSRVFARELAENIVAASTGSALKIGGLVLMVPLFTFFFLRDGYKMIRFSVGLVPNRHYEMAHDLSYLISRQLTHFVRGRVLEAIIIGLVVWAGLSMTDIRYAPLLGLFAGITNLVPYVGPLIGMLPGVLIALVDLGAGGQFWWIVAVYFLIAQVLVDNFILIPILISHFSNLHPLWVVIAIVMGGKLYGVVGMIIGVPVASIIKICLIEVRQYRRTFALPENLSDSESGVPPA